MKSPTRYRRLGAVVAAVALLGAGGVTAYTAAGDEGLSPDGSAQQLDAGPSGPHRFTEAEGLNAAEAQPVFTLANGETVSIVGNSQVECLIRSMESRSADEPCVPRSEVIDGRGITVGDECGTSGRQLMEIVGLAPEGATSVRLENNDGSSTEAPVVDGAFKFDATNPAPGEPYPTAVEWLGAEGAHIGTAGLPVDGDQFCPPTT